MRLSYHLLATLLLACGLWTAADAQTVAKVSSHRTSKTVPVAKALSYSEADASQTIPMTRRQARMAGVQSPASRPAPRVMSSAPSLAPNIVLRGEVVDADTWLGTPSTYDISQILVTDGVASFKKLGTMRLAYSMMYDNWDGILYASGVSSESGYVSYDVDLYRISTWKNYKSWLGDTPTFVMGSDCARDPSTGDVYSCVMGVNSKPCWAQNNFHLVDEYTAGPKEIIKILPETLIAVGCTNAGQYYAMGASGKFYKVDKTTGELTLVAQTDVESTYKCSGCVNDDNNTFLMTYANDTEAGLVEIDLATGATATLAKFPDGQQVAGLHIAKPMAQAKAPAVPGLEVTPRGAELKAAVKVTLPVTLNDGTPAAGETFTWKVYVNDEPKATGTAKAGATAETEITVETAGSYEVAAVVANATGDSPQALIKTYIGPGVPKAPANVVLVLDGTKATLTWDAVTESNGGWFDARAVKYNVMDETGKTVATGLTETTWSATFDLPAGTYRRVSYSVKAVNNNVESEATRSNVIGLGNYTAPMSMNLDKRDTFDEHTVIDANTDHNTWRYYDGHTIYTYHDSNNGDDWLMSPPVYLEGGKVYEFTVSLAASSNYSPEKIEVKYGTAPTVEAMTSTAIEPVEFLRSEPRDMHGMLRPATSGLYHIGFHAISRYGRYRITLYSYDVEEAVDPATPEAPSELTVTPAANGDLKATVAFKAPAQLVVGTPISGNVSCRIYRGETLVTTLSCTPGEAASYEDAVPEKGTYEYVVRAVNGEVEGLAARVSAYVGPATPANVKGVNLWQNGMDVNMTWEPVTTDVDGKEIPAANVTYDVYQGVVQEDGLHIGSKLNGRPLTDTEFTAELQQNPDEQTFLYLLVRANNRDVNGSFTSGAAIVGKPYELPVRYSAAPSEDLAIVAGGSGTVGRGTDAESMHSADNDGCFYYISNATASETYLETGRINLNVEKPILTLCAWRVSADDNNLLNIYVKKDGAVTKVLSVDNSTLSIGKWNKIRVDLGAYKGETVQLRIGSEARGIAVNFLDNITVKDELDYDVGAHSINVPLGASSQEEFDVTVTAGNEGIKTATGVSVELMRDGKTVDTKTMADVAPDAFGTVTFRQKLNSAERKATFQARLVLEGDGYLDNNLTGKATVTRSASKLPVVENLAGAAAGNDNALTWDAIDTSRPVDREIVEDFESAVSWADQLDGWAFVDVDGGDCGGFKQLEIPGHPLYTPASFYVFDASLDKIQEAGDAALFAAHSGYKYLASMYVLYQNVDDWAISPLITDNEQTISFWAAGLGASDYENIEVWASSLDSTDPKDFTKVKDYPRFAGTWKEYTAKMPAGTKRFAIRSYSKDGFMLRIDDVRYTARMAWDNLVLKGYNVYCDRVLLNEAPLAAASFAHLDGAAADHTYNVSAVYDKGESELSESLTLSSSGIGSVSGDTQAVVFVDGRNIVVSCEDAASVAVTATDGRMVYTGRGSARVSVAPGIYVVTVGHRAVKVMVR